MKWLWFVALLLFIAIIVETIVAYPKWKANQQKIKELAEKLKDMDQTP